MSKPESETFTRPTLGQLPDLLRARADDVETLNNVSGPRAVPAVRACLRHLADILSGENALVHKRPPVVKRPVV
jgi:hypothetical protein